MKRKQPTDAQRRLAETITKRLFTNGYAEVAARLVLTGEGPVFRDLGRWSQAAVVDQIADALAKETNS